MKKLLSVLLSLALVTAGISIVAANYESPEEPIYSGGSHGPTNVGRPAVPPVTAKPTATPEVTATPEATVDPEATPETTEAPTASPEATLAPTATPDAGSSEIEGGIGYNDATAGSDIGDGLVPDDYVEYKSYDVWATDEYQEAHKGEKIRMTIDADLYENDEFTTLVNYGNGWFVLDPSNVVVNGDGTVTVTLDKVGLVSFWVNGEKFPVFPGLDVPTPDVDDVPSGETDYTVDVNVDYTVVSPQTGYAEAWVVDTYLSTIL